jgi:hypothetical protein
MYVGGGFVPMELALIEAPQFTLYGDNTVVFRPSIPAGGVVSMEQPAYVKAVMTPEQVDALLAFALQQGGLSNAREDYTNVGIADAPNTVFTIDAGGVQKTVTIAGLGFDLTGPDGPDLQRFTVLADLLDGFETEVERGNVVSTEPFQPELYRAYLPEAFEGQTGDWQEWPWDDLTVDDFAVAPDSGHRGAILTAEQVAEVVEVPSGGVGGILLETDEGERFQLAVRPLLPDEAAAVASD